MEPWTTKRILIIGMTYPAYSKKYAENACTGGIEESTYRMVRIHPVPVRYLEATQRFHKFQWITAKVRQHEQDPRPESLRVEPSSISVGDVIPATKSDERRRYVEKSPHLFKSVEELKDRWDKDRTSLGAIKPKEITGIRLTARSAAAKAEWKEKEDALLSQTTMEFLKPPKKIDFPEVEFNVSWLCDDTRCKGHEMGMLQWGLHELYRKLAKDPARNKKVVDSMHADLDLRSKDVFLFLGNFRGKMFNFGLMDSFSPGRRRQLGLGIE